MNIERLLQTRNNRFYYYMKGLGRIIYPKSLLKIDYKKLEEHMHHFDEDTLLDRLNYYNQNTKPFSLGDHGIPIKDIPIKGAGSMYWFDLMEYARYFPQDASISYLFRDVTHVPEIPTLVKSRPIATADNPNQQSVLYKFVKIRHFKFIDDTIPFQKKKNKLVWRGAAYKQHRIDFLKQFFDKSPLIDIAQHNKNGNLNPQWQKPFMSISEQLQNKFILSIEGNDVATSTKWILSSNSLLFMKKPKYETWFMEGNLAPDIHYVKLKDDYSDIKEKIEHYIDHPEKAEEIIHNANQWTEQFKDPYIEDWLSFKVLEQYFQYSNQYT
ncbi:MAG: lipopolysaccharide A protein [Gammaproteobacteria bacterium]|jgi:hypothetical protein|nr:lipopolysaccharide A protein [Gammaproteobacteria bacterium]MBT4606979.1 lipopolysaccharide A protein [Thiotrichales bacterium]MBT5465347.1 lipopolysaccharide A protein [Candidatus Neomarinimicrobiota bacterium]MBT3968112.1 lipopolysaccharide A protein [Gammaproteobacteria bacterium]MBT4081178.1 lipopolysaccharide A protein [Gammaproteobacteria bacterium]